MALIVAAAGVPHTPVFPQLARDGDQSVAARYRAVAEVLEAARPDVLMVWGCDHLNAFFLDHWPSLAVAVGDTVRGPADHVPGIDVADFAVHTPLAQHVLGHLVANGFDPGRVHERVVDHAFVVPLHFLNPRRLPIVPMFLNGMVAPLPPASRCLDAGRATAAGVAGFASDLRVAVLASGAFSLEVAGPRIDPDRMWSVPRPDWAREVVDRLAAGRPGDVVGAATPERIADAGTVGGELLAWLAMCGAVGEAAPVLVDHVPGDAHAFVAWSLA